MALDPSKLASGLEALAITTDVASAANDFSKAWEDYFTGASVAGAPVTGSLQPAQAAMAGVLLGLVAPGVGPAVIAGAIGAFWTSVIALGPTLWKVPPGAVTIVVPPVGIAALPAALSAAFAAHTAAALSKAASAQAIAAILHSSGGLGGIATVFTPPAATVPTPIL